MATGGSARGADGARRRCPPQAQKDGRNVPKNPVTKTVVAVGLGRGAYAGSANKSKPDGDQKIAVQGSSERSLIRHTSSAFRWVRRGYSASERGESSDDGGQCFRCSPEGRRSGDVGGAGLLTDFQPDLSTRSERRGDASTNYTSTTTNARTMTTQQTSPPSFRRGLGGGPAINRPKPVGNSAWQIHASKHRVSPASGGNVRRTKGGRPITAHHQKSSKSQFKNLPLSAR